VVNYEDPNYNISIPVFSIHGNHDDPAGVRNYHENMPIPTNTIQIYPHGQFSINVGVSLKGLGHAILDNFV